jgi:hypothetical protein
MTAPQPDKPKYVKYVSDCCHVPVRIGGDDVEGLSYYVCTNCENMCDAESWKPVKVAGSPPLDPDEIEPKPIKLPTYREIPRWLILQGAIDYRIFILEQTQKERERRTPIERMVDESTGYDKKMLDEAIDLIAELKWLKAEYDKEMR